MNFLEVPDAGRISIAGVTIDCLGLDEAPPKDLERKAHELRQHVGMVFQQFNLFPHMTILENTMLAPRVAKNLSYEEVRASCLLLLEKVGLEAFAGRYPSQMSGGQQQRAAIAAQTGQPAETLQVVYLEAGCHFLSFFGTDFTPDVLVQRGYDRSIEALQAAGLNPIPVQWSEMDKMGVSMRSSVLLLKFLKSNVSGMLTKNVRSRSTPRWQAHQLTSGDGTGGALPPPSE